MVDSERLLARFLRYVQIDTTAMEGAACYPSSPGQITLGKMLVEELRELAVDDVVQDEHGIVTATIRSTVDHPAATIALNAHLDTSPETSGRGVRPQVIRDYAGGDITLPGDPARVIRAADDPQLAQSRGSTLVTSDGTTLLGGDDKAGVAVIMELAALLAEHPEIDHGPLRILFTCDEEIGRGVDHVDIPALGAVAAYTLDGPAANQIDVETFSADLATVTVRGVNIHPSIARDRMVNAVRAAGAFVARLPRERLSPETTADRAGFVHPYELHGGVAEATLKVLLRDFETEALAAQADLLKQVAAEVEQLIPGCAVAVQVRPQYRNMRDGLAREPRAVSYAQAAHRRLGRTAELTVIRGGTDGSQLTERGLPTPNLSTGQHNPHSPLEWVCLDEMVQAVEVLRELVQCWAAAED